MTSFFDLSRTGFGLPLIWIFAGGALLGLMPRKRARWSRSAAFLLVMPLILWAGFRSGGVDTYNYIAAFDRAGGSPGDIPGLLTSGGKDPGFAALMVLTKALGFREHWQFFLLVAAIQVLCMAAVLRRYSVSYWTSIFLFILSTDYLSWMENGMRQFLAVCLTFAAFPLLVRGRRLRYGLTVLAAATIHTSALLMLPLGWILDERPLGRKTLSALCLLLAFSALPERSLPLLEGLLEWTPYAGLTHNPIWTGDDGTNLLRVAVYSVPAVLSMIGRQQLYLADRATALCINASALTMGLYCFSAATSGIYAGRLPIYTTLHGYIALPWLLEHVFTRRSARLLKGLMMGCYLIFYWYQVRVTWGW